MNEGRISMKVRQARSVAAEWVNRYAAREASFIGAYFSGSTINLPADAVMPRTSDIDVVVVMDAPEPPPKLGKFVYQDALLEITYLSWNQLSSAEEVLASPHLAGSFRTDTLIADPAGQLRKLQAEVSRHFADPIWVRRRCKNVFQKIENGLRAIDPSAPWHDQVTAWLFSTGITTHALLVAGLRNPTVRLRYLAVRNLLMDYGLSDCYPELLSLLGCEHMAPQRVEHHLHQLARTFDAACAKAKTPFFFSSDITPAARPVAIDGSRELIHAGCHREAVFWIVATFARCHKILAADAPDLEQKLAHAFHAILSDLGITSQDALMRRAEESSRFLPRLWDITEAILQSNPEIV